MKPETLEKEIVTALKAGDKPRVSILRQVKNEVKNIQVNERRDPTEADVDAMIKRVLKQTGETLEASEKAANDEERTTLLRTEVEILEGYLPKQVEGDELVALIDKTIAEGGFAEKRDMGKVMGALGAATGGNFDKAAAARIVGERLS